MMLHCRNSEKLSTLTTDGRVPHLLARIGGYDLEMPVKLSGNTKEKNTRAIAVRDKFGFVYALPGGKQISLNGDIR
jgi:hypothetical protein